jgi:membrane protease subunit HflK
VKRWIALLLAVCAAYAATGLYFVQPDEQVVVRRFGRILAEPREPGPHFGLPWGLDRIDRVKTREVKQVTIGPVSPAGEAVGASVAQWLTGDRNLVRIRATVHYTIADPAQYLLRATAVDPLIANGAQAALSAVLAGQPVDRVLTLGKRELGVLLGEKLQAIVTRYEVGVSIRSVDVGGVEPPPEVAEAFDNVINALRQRDREINLARGYADRMLAQAQADKQRIVDGGQADHDRRVREAQGETERFAKLLAEYQRSPDLTARRLYLETMAELLPKLRAKLIIGSGTPLDLSIIREAPP